MSVDEEKVPALIGLYGKAVAGTVVAGLSAAVAALQDGRIDTPEWIGIVVTVLVAAGAVWAVPNGDGTVARYGKAITSGLVAGLGALSTGLAGGADLMVAILTAVGAAIVGSGAAGVIANAPGSVDTRKVNPDVL